MSGKGARPTHGKTGQRVYRIWANMLTRCNNPNAQHYARYGGRGIKVCGRWASFANFLADMGEPPTDQHTIDRIDNDTDYTADNCRWVTLKDNTRNRSNNRQLILNGKMQCVAAWSEELGVPVQTIHSRIRLGWTDYQILTQPVDDARGNYDRSKVKRAASTAERLASVLLLLKKTDGLALIPDHVRAKGTKAILAHVQWDHVEPIAMGGADEFHNLQPLTVDDHKLKTKRDIKAIAKTKRVAADHQRHHAVMAAKATGEAPPEERRRGPKIKSRGFQPGHRPLRSRNNLREAKP